MTYQYFLYIKDYEVIGHDPIEINCDQPLHLGDIVDFNLHEIGEELDIEYDTSSFRIVQRRFAPTANGDSSISLTGIPHFDGVQ